MTRLARSLAIALVATLALAGLAAPARAGESQAVVIIDTGGTTYTRVISFSGSISGLQALSLAGASPVTSIYPGEGYAVCQLFGEGNDPNDCFGQSNGNRSWAYYLAKGGAGSWSLSGKGASNSKVDDGDVEGWSFSGTAPRFQSFCSVVGCGPPPAPDPAPAPPASSDGATGGAPSPAGTGSTPIASVPTDAASTTDAAAADPTVTAPPTTTVAGGAPRNTRRTDTQALGARPVVADDDGAGSPVGALVALVLVAAIAVVAVTLRRRGRTAG